MVVFVPARRRRHQAERIIGGFQTAGATDPSHAKSLQDMGLSDAAGFEGLAETGLFRTTSPGLWYMDLDALADYRADLQRRQLIGLVLGLAVAAIAVALGWLTRRG